MRTDTPESGSLKTESVNKNFNPRNLTLDASNAAEFVDIVSDATTQCFGEFMTPESYEQIEGLSERVHMLPGNEFARKLTDILAPDRTRESLRRTAKRQLNLNGSCRIDNEGKSHIDVLLYDDDDSVAWWGFYGSERVQQIKSHGGYHEAKRHVASCERAEFVAHELLHAIQNRGSIMNIGVSVEHDVFAEMSARYLSSVVLEKLGIDTFYDEADTYVINEGKRIFEDFYKPYAILYFFHGLNDSVLEPLDNLNISKRDYDTNVAKMLGDLEQYAGGIFEGGRRLNAGLPKPTKPINQS
jgi:hypothetical protein